jgi:hypothetical protein
LYELDTCYSIRLTEILKARFAALEVVWAFDVCDDFSYSVLVLPCSFCIHLVPTLMAEQLGEQLVEVGQFEIG